MAGLYEIIAELRREHQSPAAARTLDLVTEHLGMTQDNLRRALSQIPSTAIPVGGQPVLEELVARAEAEHVDNLTMGYSEAEIAAASEKVDVTQVGIALIFAFLTLFSLALVVLAGIHYVNTVATTVH